MQKTYGIKSEDKFTFLPGKSYINTSGKESEEKEIKLSDGFWSGGKFGF